MKIIAMIPARSGSKGLPGKNVKLLGGKPLIAWTIEAAKECKEISEVCLNTDSEDYFKIGLRYGATGFLRPSDLAQDETSMLDVLKDFRKNKDIGEFSPVAFLILYPTYPFRTSQDISWIIERFREDEGRPLIGLKKTKTHPFLCYKQDIRLSCDSDFLISTNVFLPNMVWKQAISHDQNKFYRRQDYPKYMELTHFACVIPTTCLREINAQLMDILSHRQNFYELPDSCNTLNIDTQEDWDYAEYLVEKRKIYGKGNSN